MSSTKQSLSSSAKTDSAAQAAPITNNNPLDSVSAHFNQFLNAEIAMNQAAKAEVFKIRHHVYCEELAFEEVNQQEQEIDEFDSRSLFSLIKHKPSNTFTSCVRIVTTGSTDELLPIEKYCMHSITNEALNPQKFNRKNIAEISRLAVKSDFRRRKADKLRNSGIGAFSKSGYSETELRCFPFIAIGLYMSAAIISKAYGITHVYVMMEPKLARSLKFIGITFLQLGDPVDYHGLRAPYYIQTETFIRDLSPNFRELFETIERDLSAQLNPSLTCLQST